MSQNAHVWLDQIDQKRIVSPDEAVAVIQKGQRVFISSGCAVPQSLVAALARRGPELADNPVIHLMTLGVAPYAEPGLSHQFRHNAFFIGPNVRGAVAEGRADYTPIFLSEIPRLFRHGRMPLDVALIQVSPPDQHGFCSYGVSVDVVKSAAESARLVIAEINPNMPRTLGDSFIPLSEIDRVVLTNNPILETQADTPDEVARRIGHHVAQLVEDGSTIQTGIGTIPDAVLASLTGKKDLGVHTEMFSDGLVDLVEQGVVTGKRKTIHTGKIVASFVMGTQRLYDFIDDNPLIEFHPTEYVNDPFRISRHDRMVAINAALQVDITGQVCADSLGTYFYSGIGGQIDFVRGAARSVGGKPIIALPSTASKGSISRIVSTLTPGAGVVTTRGDVHYIVTEYGVADLHGRSIRERALALIHIAHPDFREALMEDARHRHLVYGDQLVVLGAGAAELDRWESDYVLSGGQTVHIRPVRPDDEERQREMFYSFTTETVYHRFFEHLKAMPHERLQAYTSIDYRREMALVVLAREDESEPMVAVGAYAIDPATQSAEVAFIVREAYQGKGLGTVLFKRLIEIARVKGARSIVAEIMADNHVMIRLFHDCATGPVQSVFLDGVYRLSCEIGSSRQEAGSR